ncbi:hypothetical protein [Roseisolibacter sp. H3M3-2]|uniref:hypothetical protein n=1 Tax=Roseisolibacter sp. H3M3-2 TaxID=3031323 RepID=UPI0023D99F1B|nr:hypothetical protein [Roseisolibacter sp. H3M3-2]MDF1503968.1 hypothetical protein [Roseisolibacter sp. H3M3-2]
MFAPTHPPALDTARRAAFAARPRVPALLADAMRDALWRSAAEIAFLARLDESVVRAQLVALAAERVVEHDVRLDRFRLPLEHC